MPSLLYKANVSFSRQVMFTATSRWKIIAVNRHQEKSRKCGETQSYPCLPGIFFFLHNYVWTGFQFPKVVDSLKKFWVDFFFLPYGLNCETAHLEWGPNICCPHGPSLDGREVLWTFKITDSAGQALHLWCCKKTGSCHFQEMVILLSFILVWCATHVCAHAGGKESFRALF